MQTSILYSAKTLDFSKFMLYPHGQEGECWASSYGTFSGQGKEEVIICDLS